MADIKINTFVSVLFKVLTCSQKRTHGTKNVLETRTKRQLIPEDYLPTVHNYNKKR